MLVNQSKLTTQGQVFPGASIPGPASPLPRAHAARHAAAFPALLRTAAENSRGPIEPSRRPRTMGEMAEYSYLVLYLPRGTSRDAARRILTDHAEYGDWELARLRLFADGSRKATLRRQIIRAVRTL